MRRALVAIVTLGLGLAGGAAPGEAATAARRIVCMSTVPAGTDNVLLLEFTAGGRFSMGLTGIFASSLGFGGPPPQPGIPVAGAARLRADGKVDFAVTGMASATPVSVSGIVDPPNFDQGNGFLRIDFVADPPGTVAVPVTFFPVGLEACVAALGDASAPAP